MTCRRSNRNASLATCLSALLLLAACGSGVADGTTSADPPVALPSTTVLPCSATPRTTRETGDVLVFFACADDGRTYAFSRPAPADASIEQRLSAAVSAYIEGPAPGEPTGLYGFAATGTSNALNSAAVHGDRAVIDLDMTDVASTTSAQSAIIWKHLRALAFQFPEIDEVEPRYNSSCRRFAGVVEAGDRCLVGRRGSAG